jgi:diguanylate cyclase (GGDEF)-like protein
LSFKYRLRAFFFLLTVLPLLAAGYAVQEISRQNQTSRVDANLASSIGAGVQTYEFQRLLVARLASQITRNQGIVTALANRDGPTLRRLLSQYQLDPLQVSFFKDGLLVTGVPLRPPDFASSTTIVDSQNRPFGTLVVGFELNRGVAGQLSTKTVTVGFATAQTILTQNGPVPLRLPAHGVGAFDAQAGATKVRALVRSLGDSQSPGTAIVATYPRSSLDAAAGRVERTVVIAVLIVLVAILILAELLVRSITGQLAVFARRAREVGQGAFVGDLPVHGNDEFALFARSFNQMAAELEQRIEEVESARRRVQEAVGRFGQALESTHDVTALLGIVVASAMETVSARGARVMIVDEATGSLVEQRRLGSAVEASTATLPDEIVLGSGIEGVAAQTGRPALQNDPVPVLCVPLQSTQSVIGLLTLIDPIRRPGGAEPAFTEEDAQTLQGLAAQGAIAIENARMHRLVAKQASTDGLTGLANHREFQDQLRREVERAQRFALPLALILLDLDDFKLINDRFSHLTGDSVLRAVAATLRTSIREIDCAARYGGEEFAVILPGTTSEGAARLAERLRIAIAERPVTFAEDRVVSVTASFGVAALPADGATQVELVAAADEALYDAKRAGKNRVVIAVTSRDRHP